MTRGLADHSDIRFMNSTSRSFFLNIPSRFAMALAITLIATSSIASDSADLNVRCLKTLPTEKGLYLTLVKGEKWTVAQHSDNPLFVEPWPDHTEMIFVSENLKTIYTVYANLPFYKQEGKNYYEIQCSAWVSAKNYSGCKSEFFSTNIAGTAGRTAIAAVLTFGIAAGANKSLSLPRVLEVVAEADAINYTRQAFLEMAIADENVALEKSTSSVDLQRFVDDHAANDPADLVAEAKLRHYRAELSEAKTTEELQRFIRAYADNDPENRIAIAKQRLPEAQVQETAEERARFASAQDSFQLRAFLEHYTGRDSANLIETANKKLSEVVKAEEAERKRQASLREAEERKAAKRQADEEKAKQAKLDAWRKGLKVGDDTFCGPVIEVRLPMVKIAVNAPLQGYPSEAWLKLYEVYPNWMAGCHNVNGRLSALF
jgi:hypothetical protein